MTKLTCVICGREFWGYRNGVCCSNECRRVRNLNLTKARKMADREVRVCMNCGKVLEPTRRGEERRCVKFCSDECRSEYYTKLRAMRKPKVEKDSCNTSCDRKKTCYYGREMYTGGKLWYCAYLEITGNARGGNPKDCTHYRKRGKKC